MASFWRSLAVGSCLPASCYGSLILSRDNGQTPLVRESTYSQDLSSRNETVCDAGSRQWTGHVPLGKGRNMFYWYFESLVRPEEAPLVIWTNGGPGGSSMLGAFFEIGPCIVSEAGNTTSRNPLSWTTHASMLFIDQPIGVGLSATAEPLFANSLIEGGIDVDKFLDVFLTDLFPELSDRPIHFAGESFGGKYVPVYTAMTRRRFESIILVDPSIDPALQDLSMYLHYCPEKRERWEVEKSSPPRYLNETACAAMEAAYSKCDKLRRACVLTYDADTCWLAAHGCQEVTNWFMDEIRPGGRDPYDDRRVCKEAPLCNDLGDKRTNIYLNLPHVKHALGLPANFKYESISWRFNEVWNTIPDIVLPSTREITALLDNKHTRVLVINGNNDGIITTEGIIMAFDELPWHGQAAFRRLPYRPWHYLGMDGAVSGGQVKSYGNLTVVTVDEAGHMSPHDQPDATLQLLGSWLGRS
ncbi:carboxypeptidase Y [Coniochaeta ligniaria NRRL 30616]|uniref:Carboxypeptidase Y n=1 Tax=Coniochaeta ligniaria NRRL 30616 TaxID=1408157 RepID=A0A1J7IYB7_9PEZI|nr:carboxypeptidase Y [Coniochaeta ligniaria NRRL 30616]